MTAAETALIGPVAEAEPVAAWHRVHSPAGLAGMPPHVTLLTPCVPVDRAGEVAEVLAAFPPFDFELARTARFSDVVPVLYLAPEPAAPFAAITAALVERFPDYQPYAGLHATVVPHLTVATQLDPEVLDAIELEVSRILPIAARGEETWLMELSAARWRRVTALPLGLSSAAS